MLTLCSEQKRHIAKQKQCLENLKEQVDAHRARQVSLSDTRFSRASLLS